MFFISIFIFSTNVKGGVCGDSDDFIPVLDSDLTSSIYSPTGITLNNSISDSIHSIYFSFNDDYIKAKKECSGVLVGRDVFLTAGHCVQGYFAQGVYENNKPTYVGFNYHEESGEEYYGQTYEPNVTLFKIDQNFQIEWGINSELYPYVSGFDYAVLKLLPNGDIYPGDQFGTANLRTGLTHGGIGTNSYILSHPELLPTKYSSGYIFFNDTFRYYYNIDTEGGSSGAPVYLNDDVVAVHFAGECEVGEDSLYTLNLVPANIGTSIRPFLPIPRFSAFELI